MHNKKFHKQFGIHVIRFNICIDYNINSRSTLKVCLVGLWFLEKLLWAVGHGKTAVKIKRPFGWAAVIFYQKTVKGTHISSTIIPMRPSRERGAAWGGRGDSTTMRAGTRAHKTGPRTCWTRLVMRCQEGRGGAPRKRSREGGESDEKKTQTGIYIINGKWVICMPNSQ